MAVDVAQQFREWWPLILSFAGLIAGAAGWQYGVRSKHERNSWRIDQLEEDVTDLSVKVAALQSHQNESGMNLTVIEVSLRQIKEMLTEVREDMKTKADK